MVMDAEVVKMVEVVVEVVVVVNLDLRVPP